MISSIKLINYYEKSWKIIKENKKIILALAIIYILALVSGIIYNITTYTNPFSSKEVKTSYDEFKKLILYKDTFVEKIALYS